MFSSSMSPTPKKKILFIATGGTIGSVKVDGHLKPHFTAEDLLGFFSEAKKVADIEVLDLIHIDSTNVHPKHWTLMAEAVFENYDTYDGFIIGHGTDTISYSASALSYALKGLLKPVVFTGSVLSLEHPESDAKTNFLNSVKVAASDLVKEVCICFNHKIIKGTRARKITNEATKITNHEMGVYSSINFHLIGSFDLGQITENKIYFTKNGYPKESTLELFPKFDPNLGLLKLFPGISSNVLDFYSDKKAIVIEAFGPGNIPYDYSHWLEKISQITKKGIPICILTQNPFGEVDLDMYEVGKKASDAGAIACQDMITEAAIVKLMWIFGNYPEVDFDEVKKLFLTNISGEIIRTDDYNISSVENL